MNIPNIRKIQGSFQRGFISRNLILYVKFNSRIFPNPSIDIHFSRTDSGQFCTQSLSEVISVYARKVLILGENMGLFVLNAFESIFVVETLKNCREIYFGSYF